MNRGGIYKRMGPGQIMDFVIVEDFDRVLAEVEKLGGRILMPKNSIKSVGFVAVIQDTEGKPSVSSNRSESSREPPFYTSCFG